MVAHFPKECKPCRHLVSIIRECELRLMLSERMTIYMILAISSEFTLTIDTYLRFEELNELWKVLRQNVNGR